MCPIRVGSTRLSTLVSDWLPLGAAVGDQPGDGEHGVLEMFTASDVALQEPLSGSAMACSTQIHCEGWAFAQCGIGQLRLWCLLRWFLRRGCMDRPGGVMRLGGGR